MQFDKQEIIKLLREQGQHDRADKAEQQLPQRVDHEQHAGLLSGLGIDPQKLLGKL